MELYRVKLGRSIIFVILAIGTTGVWGFTHGSQNPVHRFEAHEFAVFRSEYDTLRDQRPEKRVEHFRNLLDATETARLTPGMRETLAAFCRNVANSPEEAPPVRAEARRVARSLDSEMKNRMPASVEPGLNP
jgi:hypothetical protein